MVYTYTGKVVDVAWLCQSDDRMDEDVSLSRTGCTDGQFSVRSMHGITGLESYDAGPAKFLEMYAQFGWRIAQGDVVVVI